MGIEIRNADPCKNRDRLIPLLRQHLNPLTDRTRFDWLYLHNPDGVARVWIAVDTNTSEIIGSCAALPRNCYVDGQPELCCVLADFWIHPDFRYLGPALQLQKACVEGVLNAGFALAYDLPRKQMSAVYRRMRIVTHDHVGVFSKLLRADRYISNRIRPAWLAHVFSSAINPVIKYATRTPRTDANLQVALEEGSCGPEFTEFAEGLASNAGLQVARHASYLNWRFRRHFHHRYEFLVARRSDIIVGYAVLLDQPDSHQLDIADFLAESAGPGWLALIAKAFEVGHDRRRSLLNVSLLSSDPRCAVLLQSGFRLRSESALVLINGAHRGSRTGPTCRSSHFTYGDESD